VDLDAAATALSNVKVGPCTLNPLEFIVKSCLVVEESKGSNSLTCSPPTSSPIAKLNSEAEQRSWAGQVGGSAERLELSRWRRGIHQQPLTIRLWRQSLGSTGITGAQGGGPGGVHNSLRALHTRQALAHRHREGHHTVDVAVV